MNIMDIIALSDLVTLAEPLIVVSVMRAQPWGDLTEQQMNYQSMRARAAPRSSPVPRQ
jgi:hypothetical protein